MDEFSNVQENEIQDKRETIKQKLRQYYDGRIVRKDLTKSIREGANVPVMYWNISLDNTATPTMRRLLKKV